MSGVVLTAGYDRSTHAVAIAELLLRRGVNLSGVIVVSHFSTERIRAVIRHKGIRPLVDYALKRRPADDPRTPSAPSPLRVFLDDNKITPFPLTRWARSAGVPICTVAHINHDRAIRFLRELGPDRVIYAGGGILRSAFIDAAGGRVLNAHSGPLPEVRGMNACEWSVLLGLHPAVTIHLVDRGIDTGPVLETIRISVMRGDSIGSLRERCTVAGILALVSWALAPLSIRSDPGHSPPASRQCFVLAPALHELLSRRLPDLLNRYSQ